jgi:hypothetical protein
MEKEIIEMYLNKKVKIVSGKFIFTVSIFRITDKNTFGTDKFNQVITFDNNAINIIHMNEDEVVN